jgi:hypothetical protein
MNTSYCNPRAAAKPIPRESRACFGRSDLDLWASMGTPPASGRFPRGAATVPQATPLGRAAAALAVGADVASGGVWFGALDGAAPKRSIIQVVHAELADSAVTQQLSPSD